MIENEALCGGDRPLDSTTLELMKKHATRIRNEHADMLPELIAAVLPLDFGQRTEEAKRFVDNNPLWFMRQIDTLEGVSFAGADSWHTPENHPEKLLEWIDRDTVISWLNHSPGWTLLDHPDNMLTDNSESEKFSHIKQHFPELATEYAKSVEKTATAFTDDVHHLKPVVYQALTHLAENGELDEKQQSFWLHTLTQSAAGNKKRFANRTAWVNYRDLLRTFWQRCRCKKAKYEAATAMILSRNIVVDCKTTVDAFEHIVRLGGGKEFIGVFVENLRDHCAHKHNRYRLTAMATRLKRLETVMKKEHPDVFRLWQQYNFTTTGDLQ